MTPSEDRDHRKVAQWMKTFADETAQQVPALPSARQLWLRVCWQRQQAAQKRSVRLSLLTDLATFSILTLIALLLLLWQGDALRQWLEQQAVSLPSLPAVSLGYLILGLVLYSVFFLNQWVALKR